MKAAIEQLSNDTAIVFGSLQFLETFPQEDPLRPEITQMVTLGSTALTKHLITLRERVRKRRSQCLRTPYLRVRTNYLRSSNTLFTLDRQTALDIPAQDLVLSLLDELQSNVSDPRSYTDCDTFNKTVLFRLRQFYQMTAPIRRRNRLAASPIG